LSAAEEEVNHWKIKAKCYGNIVHGCSPALAAAGFPVESSQPDGAVGGIRRAVEAMAKEKQELRAAMLDLRNLWPAERWATLSAICRDHPVIEREFCKHGTTRAAEAAKEEA
jgi:hypothetical protein